MTWRDVSEQRLELVRLTLDIVEMLEMEGRHEAANRLRTRLMTITKTSEPERLVTRS